MESKKRDGLKCLVMSHNPLSMKTNNGKTMAALLSKFSDEQLCQIYFTEGEADFRLCSSFYKISEENVLKSLFGSQKKNGKEVVREELENKYEREGDNKKKIPGLDIIKKIVHSKTGRAIRSLCWAKAELFSEEMEKWLEKEKPQAVCLGIGDIPAFLELAYEICQKYKLPLFMIIGDDYFSYERSYNIIYQIYLRKLRNAFRKNVEYSDMIFPCGERMQQKLSNEFGGKYTIAMNSVDLSETYSDKYMDLNHIQMVYIGNLGIGRWKVLLQIGKIAQQLKKNGRNIQLDIYCGYVPEKKILKKIEKIPCIKFKGAIFGEELKKVKERADVLLFVEGFEKKFKKVLYTAISTKIPEYMVTGRGLFAVGPEYSAAIEYISKNNIGTVVKKLDRKQIKIALEDFLTNENMRREQRSRAQILVQQDYSIENNAGKVYYIISQKVK